MQDIRQKYHAVFLWQPYVPFVSIQQCSNPVYKLIAIHPYFWHAAQKSTDIFRKISELFLIYWCKMSDFLLTLCHTTVVHTIRLSHQAGQSSRRRERSEGGENAPTL